MNPRPSTPALAVPAALIACAHGTRSVEGRRTIDALLGAIRDAAGRIPVVEAYVDVHGPDLTTVVAETAGAATIVPLLLSTGYHTEVDLRHAAEGAAADIRVARPLGPHPLLADVVVSRARETGASGLESLVICAAGSSRSGARDDVEQMAELVRARWAGPVSIGYAAAMEPSVPDAVAAARAGGLPVVAATYLLAPGYFADLIVRAGADLTSAPLGADPRIAQIALERYASSGALASG